MPTPRRSSTRSAGCPSGIGSTGSTAMTELPSAQPESEDFRHPGTPCPWCDDCDTYRAERDQLAAALKRIADDEWESNNAAEMQELASATLWAISPEGKAAHGPEGPF